MTPRPAPVRRVAHLVPLAALVAASTGAGAAALDARALALGGSSVAGAAGMSGVLENPASLAALQRTGRRASFLLGAGVEARDHEDLSSLLTDDEVEDLGGDIDDEVARLSGSTVSCNPLIDTDDAVCLTGVATLGELSGDALEILDRVNDNEVSAFGEARLGVAVTGTPLAFALHVGGRGAARGTALLSESDRGYVADLSRALADGDLTLGEVRDNAEEFAIENDTLTIADPEDIVTSTGRGGAMYRLQAGVSLATGFALGESVLDVGVTPKFSRLRAWGTRPQFRDAFDDDSPSLQDDFEDSETEASSFTFDAGIATDLAVLPLRVAAVIRNVIPESIETPEGIEFETTPQLIVGLAHRRGLASLTADVALNEAELDGIATRPAALGIEFGTPTFAIRGGVGADFGRDDDQVALTLGAKLGPLEIGGRVAGIERGQVAAQVRFGF